MKLKTQQQDAEGYDDDDAAGNPSRDIADNGMVRVEGPPAKRRPDSQAKTVHFVLPLFNRLANKPPAARADTGLATLMPAFMISELRRSFEIGFLLLLPFLVIDLAVAAVLMAMGMMMLPPPTISLPCKIIFFVLVDGWALVAGSLVRSFGTGA